MPRKDHDSPDDPFEAVIETFEVGWRTNFPPDIRRFAETAVVTADCRLALLHELIRVDLEYRWRIDAAKTADYARPRSLEYYVAALPEIGPLYSLPLDLIGEEYRARRLWGDRPGVSDYLERFPGREREITAALRKIDLELRTEVESAPAIAPFKSAELPGLIHIPQFDYRDFVLEAFLGSGGIGKVYRACWKTRKRHVAIKMLRKSWWRHPDARTFFFREAAILVELRHPNIVSLHGVGHFRQNGCFLVIDLVDGGDLSRRIGERLTVDQAMDWVMQAAEGLAFAHARGVVHRDIKPSNILLDRRGQIRIADFGLASAPSLSHNAADHLVGTAAYMAPEQLFNSSQHVGPAADVFSLGCVLYTLLAGRPPYEGRRFVDLVARRLALPQPLPLLVARPDLPRAIDCVVARCLATDPAQRFATAGELAEAIRHHFN